LGVVSSIYFSSFPRCYGACFPASFPAPSIGIIQIFAEKAQNAEKLKKPRSGENDCCKNAHFYRICQFTAWGKLFSRDFFTHVTLLTPDFEGDGMFIFRTRFFENFSLRRNTFSIQKRYIPAYVLRDHAVSVARHQLNINGP